MHWTSLSLVLCRVADNVVRLFSDHCDSRARVCVARDGFSDTGRGMASRACKLWLVTISLICATISVSTDVALAAATRSLTRVMFSAAEAAAAATWWYVCAAMPAPASALMSNRLPDPA